MDKWPTLGPHLPPPRLVPCGTPAPPRTRARATVGDSKPTYRPRATAWLLRERSSHGLHAVRSFVRNRPRARSRSSVRTRGSAAPMAANAKSRALVPRALTSSGLELRRRRRSTLGDVANEAGSASLFPASALYEQPAQTLHILQRLARRGVLQQIAAEDQAVRRMANAILLAHHQLARPQVVQSTDHPPIRLCTFTSHFGAEPWRRFPCSHDDDG